MTSIACNFCEAIRVIRVIRGLLLSFPVKHVYSCEFVVSRNRLDAELRRTDKGVWGKGLIQKREHATAPKWHGKIHRTPLNKIMQRLVLDRK